MRISDWSSDVCSSDLDETVDDAPQVFRLRQGGLDLLVLHQGSRQIGEHRLAVADRAVEPPAVETVTHLLSPFIPGFAHEADCAAARQVSRRERTSVVWGKSVSQRVNLGGRRII